jgi:phage terminase small subunit
MSPKQILFCSEYIKDLNGAAACVRAGYSPFSAKEQASRLLTNVNVQRLIVELKSERSKRTKIDADMVLKELASIGFSKISDYLSFNASGVSLKDSGSITLDKLSAVSEVSSTDTGNGATVKFRLHDKLSALEKIARHINFYPDKDETKDEPTITEIRKTVIHKYGKNQ